MKKCSTTLLFLAASLCLSFAQKSPLDSIVVDSLDLFQDSLITTALFLKKPAKPLPYSTQTFTGEKLATTGASNLIDVLAARVAGLQIKHSQMMAGSSNAVLRGMSSLTGSNQVLFVVDGVPIDNSVFNIAEQDIGRGGYDYGNLANDINLQEIEGVTVLKGAAATALYGARGANGAILVEMKKGRERSVYFSTSAILEQVNPQTAPRYQREYGAGIGAFYDDPSGYFRVADVNGDGQFERVVPTSEDASWGAAFDPNIFAVHWDALDPLSFNYGELRPYVAPNSSILDFFETGLTLQNHVAFSQKDFRIAYTNERTKGVLPNSQAQRHWLNFHASRQIGKRLKTNIGANYLHQNVQGRGGTGYDRLNVMRSLGQWFQANVDIEQLENYQNINGQHQTWNRTAWDDATPKFFDNPYFTRYENFQNDRRNRLFGYAMLAYEFSKSLNLQGRASTDFFSDTQEERIAKQSVETARYTKRLRQRNERNLELLLNFQKAISKGLKLTVIAGGNYSLAQLDLTAQSTKGGLLLDDVFAISNSLSPEIEVEEALLRQAQTSVFAQTSLAFSDLLFLEFAARNDWSSTLPKANRSQLYPAVSSSFVFSELFQNRFLNFGKVYFSYAQVGNEVAPYLTAQTYLQGTDFGTQVTQSLTKTLANPDLKPERTHALDLGLRLHLLQNRIQINANVYQRNTHDLLFPMEVSSAAGFERAWTNAGEIENKGVELTLSLKAIETAKFSWTLGGNWAKNQNTVLALSPSANNFQLGDHFFMTYNATLGQAYGTFKGTNYVFHENGQRIVNGEGFYEISESDTEILGTSTPDWIAGAWTEIKLGKIRLSALFDMQQGGNVYSLNTIFGRATGLYEETAALNDLGNPKRDPVNEGGGIRLEGVQADGSENMVYAPANDFFGTWNFDRNPTAAYLLDASYIKLREVCLTFDFPSKKAADKQFSLSIFGRNLAILHKNVQHFDPEQALSAGNIQGFEAGTYPTTRTLGVRLEAQF